MILARADAYVEAFELHNVPSDARAETEFKRAAQQMAGGTISGIRGELNLLQARTKRHLGHQGARLNLEIEAAARSALEEGALRLRRQRIKAESPSKFGADVARFGLSLNQRTTVESGSNPTRTGGEAEIIVFMQLVEKWRMTAGEHGGKLTQKQVAAKMKLDLRAYSAAKKGEPRGKDHPGRVRKFARDLGLI
jgi:hypothetical protein